MSFLKRNMDIPIRLPEGMPRDIRLNPREGVYLVTRGGRRAAQVSLVFGKRGYLIIQYGVSVLDGCAPEDSIAVQVSGQDGRLREVPGPETDLIWPATLEHPEGT